MNKFHESLILKHRPYCEMPDESGAPTCMNRATHVIDVPGRHCKWTMAVCDDCHKKEQPHG